MRTVNMAFSHKGLLNGKLRGQGLTVGVCFAASSGFFLLGYDRESLLLCACSS